MKNSNQSVFINADSFLTHWLGHRALTRKVFLAFPDEKLETYSIGGMRPFSELFKEIIQMAIPTLKGVATGTWDSVDFSKKYNKTELLTLWDKDTELINEWWSKIPAHRFFEVDNAFGQWEGPGHWIISYIVDNEIHHRAQGYVYLRSLGIQPPYFYDRE